MKDFAILLVAMGVLCTGVATGYVNYEYYEGTWDTVPDFDLLTPVHAGVVVNFGIGNRNRDENIGFRFKALISISAEGSYTFYTRSDDGSRLSINDTLVVNNDGTHGMDLQSGNIDLTVGEHTIEVTYFNKGGGFGLIVYYKGPGMENQEIGDDILSPVELPATHKACCPLPPDDGLGVDPAAVLQWEEPPLVDLPEYDVYFGIDPNLPGATLAAEGTVTTFDPFDDVDMAVNTKYYWRVDVYDPNTGGTPVTLMGDVWEFTTRRGLVALYEFENDPNDSSGNGYHGRFQGNAQIAVDAFRGNVLSLDGDGDYVDLVNPKTAADLGLGGNNPKSITAWVYTSAFNNGGIFDVGTHSDGQEFSLRTLNSTNQWRIQYYGGSYDIDFSHDSLGKWVHFALVHDGIFTRMYVNGTLKIAASRVLNTSGSDPFRIGQYGGDDFNGLIDDFALWDYALSPEVVRRMVLFADFDDDNDVDAADLNSLVGDWLTSTIIPGSIQPTEVLEDFEAYSATGFPGISMGWFVYLSDSGTFGAPPLIYPCSVVTGVSQAPYGGDQAMQVDYEYPVYAPADDWLVIGHYISVDDPGELGMAKYDEIRFRIKYSGANTDDVGLFFQAADEPPGVIEREAFRYGPLPTTDDPADPNQWHEIVIDLRNDETIAWQSPYGGVDDVHNFNAFLISIVNSSRDVRTGTLYFDDVRLIDYTPDCAGLPPTDINGDCIVDQFEVGILADEWMRTGL